MASQKENNFPTTKLKGIEYYNLIKKSKQLLRNSISYKKTHKDKPVKSGVKLMNRRSSLPTRLRF